MPWELKRVRTMDFRACGTRVFPKAVCTAAHGMLAQQRGVERIRIRQTQMIDMTYTHYTHTGSKAFIAAAFLCGIAATPAMAQGAQPPPGLPAPQKKADPLQQIHAELMEVQTKLQAAEQHAVSQPAVVEKRDKFNKLVDETIVEKDPSLEEKIEESKSLMEKLGSSPELRKPPESQSEEFTKDMRKFQQIEQEISLKRNEVVASEPEVRKQAEEYQKLMVDEMTKVEPETPKLLAKRDELVQRYRSLQDPASEG